MNYRVLSSIIVGATVLILSACAIQQPPQPAKPVVEPVYIQIALRDAQTIGQKIWMNEGSAKVKNLVHWNNYEDFASLGIGHFIWYPPGQNGPYMETFPDMIAFLQQQGVQIPTWLPSEVPWHSYEEFKSIEQSNIEIVELRRFLVNTIPQQVQFLIRRLEYALPKMLNNLPTETRRNHVRQQFYRVAQVPNGVYALVDYVNFKGEGISSKERYREKGWGLLQVLENMSGNTAEVMAEFAGAAEYVLKRRIQNSPPERNEHRWFNGWKNRVKTYL